MLPLENTARRLGHSQEPTRHNKPQGAEQLLQRTDLFSRFLDDSTLKVAELSQFNWTNMTFSTVWSSLQPRVGDFATIMDVHNTALLEVLIHGDPISTPDYSPDGFRDWQNLQQKTGLEHFITIPLVLFSHEYRDFVLTAGADAPLWSEVLRHIMSSMDNIRTERA